MTHHPPSRKINIDENEPGFQTLVSGHGDLFHDYVLGPLAPLPPVSCPKFTPELFALRYDIHFNYSPYYVYWKNVEVAEWEVAPVTTANGVHELGCFIRYMKHSGEIICSAMGVLPLKVLRGRKSERAFGKRKSLLPPRWYAKACLDMYNTYATYHGQDDV
mgnify:CR=1 FL=1